MRAALVQMCSSDVPAENLSQAERMIRQAAAEGAELVLTPEVTNIMSASRTRQEEVLAPEASDPTLARLRAVAAETGVWLVIGSLALKTGDPDGRFANRSFLIAPDGAVAARYDKIHMFDVDLDGGETYRESAGFRPGEAGGGGRGGRGEAGPHGLLRPAISLISTGRWREAGARS
jgi:deaminated glutathione amidase